MQTPPMSTNVHQCPPMPTFAETIMRERWKDIPLYEGIYQVSNKGRVRSLDRVDSIGRPRAGRMLKLNTNSAGYTVVTLCKDGVAKSKSVHRLVLAAFVGPCPVNMECCHNDGDRSNNYLSNLRWDTQSNNTKDSIQHGTYVGASKKAVVREDGQQFESACEAAKHCQAAQSHISEVCLGKRKTAGGFSWKFA